MNRILYCSLAFIMVISCKQSTDASSTNNESILKITSYVKERIDSTLESFVKNGDIAGASALVYEQGTEIYYNDFGYADMQNEEKFDRKTIVQIYSMTKPITGAALMTLYEEAAFNLDDPISKYAPEFKNMTVFTGVNDAGEILTEPVEREITIRDLTRHTAGFANNPSQKGIGPLLAKADPLNRENTLEEMAEKFAGLPLLFHPGEQWEYGPCVDLQAYLVERISGIPYNEYVRKKILDPLKMNKTRYFVPEDERNHFSAMYKRSNEGVLTQVEDSIAHSNYTTKWPLFRGGSGLTSTIDDYMKFAQMLVNKGTYEGTTILQPATVELMATNHLDEKITKRSWLPSKGQVGFGIDFAVRLAPPESEDENMGEVGEFFWDGAASTLFWVDPVNEITAVLFVQLMPYDQIGLHRAFRKAIYTK